MLREHFALSFLVTEPSTPVVPQANSFPWNPLLKLKYN